MSHPFDATLKSLGKDHAADFLALFDSPPTRPVKPINVDLSTVTASTDVAFGLGDPPREVVALDFQASANRNKGRSVLVYNALLHDHYQVPVRSVLVLLRPAAEHSEVDGRIAYASPDAACRMEFGYKIVRLWQIPAERLLEGPLGTVPFAVLGELPEGAGLSEALSGVVRRVWERVIAEAEPPQGQKLIQSAFELLGLLVKKNEARAIMTGIPPWEESPVYQAILDIGYDKGREEAETKRTKLLIVRLARKRLGEPDEGVRLRLDAITDLERLERLFDRAPDALSWDDLLSTP
ncbi:MAG: DUF4351 domain-containing protein [Gemmataceae bacterium]|nr:DUF4351 domain-containing protein [Gemmataceae bacterium]